MKATEDTGAGQENESWTTDGAMSLPTTARWSPTIYAYDTDGNGINGTSQKTVNTEKDSFEIKFVVDVEDQGEGGGRRHLRHLGLACAGRGHR